MTAPQEAARSAYTDGPNTHKYRDAHFITNWTLVNLTDPDGVEHHFHVPTRILEMERALVIDREAKPGLREGFRRGIAAADWAPLRAAPQDDREAETLSADEVEIIRSQAAKGDGVYYLFGARHDILALLATLDAAVSARQEAEIARWIDSLHEDANGTVWTTKAELRAVLTRSDAGLRSIPESPEPLPSRLPERTAFESDPESP